MLNKNTHCVCCVWTGRECWLWERGRQTEWQSSVHMYSVVHISQYTVVQQGEQQDLERSAEGRAAACRTRRSPDVEVVFFHIDPSVYIPLHAYTPISPTLNYRTSNGTIVIVQTDEFLDYLTCWTGNSYKRTILCNWLLYKEEYI